MEITSIERAKDGLFTITFGAQRKVILPLEIIVKENFCVGDTVDIIKIRELSAQSTFYQVLAKSNAILARRSCSVEEIRRRLLKEFDKDVVSQVIETLLEMDLLDDERYAKELAYNYIEVKQYGYYRALGEMCRKGIDSSIVADALSVYTKTTAERIGHLISLRYSDWIDSGDMRNIQKARNALARRGFDFSDIDDAIKNYLEDCDDETEDEESFS